VGDRAKLALKIVREETGSITHLTESTKAPGRPEHHPAAIWLVGAFSALVGFVLVDVMPITALLLTVVLTAGLLGLSAFPSLRGRRQFLFALGLGFAIPVVVYFSLAIAQH
jgi:Flp pilus assembly protein TadB